MLLSNLKFGAFLSYVPKKEEHKWLIQAIKQDKVFPKLGITISERIAKEVKEKLLYDPKFSDFFGNDISLVPVPKSSLVESDTLVVSKRLAVEFSKLGMGTVLDCLERKIPVLQSHLLKPKDRHKPIVHYQSIVVKKSLKEPQRILLLDDVLTRGSTFLGCASLLKEAFPNATINAFAAVQTISDPNNFKNIEDPYVGEIILYPDGSCSTNR